MEPQKLSLDCEALDEFRWAMDAELRRMVVLLENKELDSGTLTGKISVEIERNVTQDGEIIRRIHIKPNVNIKIKADEKCELMKKDNINLVFDSAGMPVIATDQISMEDVIKKGA